MFTFNPQVVSGVEKVGKLSSLGIGFAYLAILSFCSTLLVVCLLTAYQFQHSIRTASIDGQPIELWKVIEVRDGWRNVQSRLSIIDAQIQQTQSVAEQMSRNYDIMQFQQSEYARDVVNVRRKILSHFISLNLMSVEFTESVSNNHLNAAGELKLALKKLSDGDDKKALQLELNKYEEVANENYRREGQLGLVKSEAARISEDMLRLENKRKTVSGELAYILNPTGDKLQNSFALGHFVSQLNALDSTWLGSLGQLATLEPDLLTLLLVLSMGVLGGTIHLARKFIAGEETSVSYFVYRPFLGAITALIIFIVARTGVFVIAEAPSNDNTSPLSPFFISFVAILSGLLADQALESVQAMGAKFFTGTVREKSERYPVGIVDLIQTLKLDSAQLVKTAGLTEVEVADLVAGNKLISAENQRLIAVWTGKPVREIFSDLPP